MPDIKWMHLDVNLPDDEKIKIIESMPEADSICFLWVKLMCLAGKINDRGYVYISPEVPYTVEQLASVLRRPLNTVRLALDTFRQLKMIDANGDGYILLNNFLKWNDQEALERIREQGRERLRRFRERQKQLLLPERVTLLKRPVTQEEEEEEEEEEEDKEKEKELRYSRNDFDPNELRNLFKEFTKRTTSANFEALKARLVFKHKTSRKERENLARAFRTMRQLGIFDLFKAELKELRKQHGNGEN